MLFNSFSFLFFLAVLVVLYYAIPAKWRWMLLGVASLYFYSTFKQEYVLLLLGVALATYLWGLAVQPAPGRSRRGLLIGAAVCTILVPLFVCKYYDFSLDSLAALMARAGSEDAEFLWPKLGWVQPAGLSFFTFSCVSYLVDVYRGQIPAERNLARLFLYVAFFPKLLAGPIERATAFLPQLSRPLRFDPAMVTAGLQLILWGLFKKVVIADRLSIFVGAAYKHPMMTPPVDLLIATYFFAFQIYCDFSGYADMAIGIGRVFGIDLMENFRRPYFATSVGEFWSKRWHISLTKWFRDYMFIPLGGSRVSKPRVYFNLMAVFVVSGLWHGANWTFVVWGGLNGLYQVIALVTAGLKARVAQVVRLPAALVSFLNALVTFHLILVTWVFFRAASIADAFTVCSRVASSLVKIPAALTNHVYNDELILSFMFIGVLLIIEALDEARSLWERLGASPVYLRWTFYYALLICLIVFGKWNLTEFVYMQF